MRDVEDPKTGIRIYISTLAEKNIRKTVGVHEVNGFVEDLVAFMDCNGYEKAFISKHHKGVAIYLS